MWICEQIGDWAAGLQLAISRGQSALIVLAQVSLSVVLSATFFAFVFFTIGDAHNCWS